MGGLREAKEMRIRFRSTRKRILGDWIKNEYMVFVSRGQEKALNLSE